MLTVACKTNHRFRLEVNLKTVFTENLFYKCADEKLVIRGLQCIGKFPVNLNLLAYMGHVAGFINVCLETANLFMTHLCAKAVIIKHRYALLKSCADCTACALPVLLLHNL